MKIGILTYHRAHNYGAVLQAYALKTFLQSQRKDNVVFVDYWPEYHKDVYRLFRRHFFKSLSLTGKLKYLIYLLIYAPRLFRQRHVFLDFINKFIVPTDKIDANYDVIIYGSDQIWRYQNYPGTDGYNPIYFASDDIASHYRIAYSASMGIINDTDELRTFLTKALNNFDYIGVREKDLFDYIKPFVSCPICHTIDPIFLLNGNEWEKYIPSNLIGRKYILMLHWQAEADLIPHMAEQISQNANLPIVKVYGYKYASKSYGPLEFLSLIKNAEYVVSSSFHGVAFAVIFNKTFFTYLKSNQHRVLSLLDAFDLQTRFITSINQICISDQIKWDIVNHKIASWKNRSASFLLSALDHCSKIL